MMAEKTLNEVSFGKLQEDLGKWGRGDGSGGQGKATSSKCHCFRCKQGSTLEGMNLLLGVAFWSRFYSRSRLVSIKSQQSQKMLPNCKKMMANLPHLTYLDCSETFTRLVEFRFCYLHMRS